MLTEELSNSDVATDDLERYFIYATTWAFGSFLSTQNKIIFNQWWRETFNRTRTELCFPENGLIWDYFVKPGLSSFSSWDEDSLHFSPPTDSTLSPFVPTVHSKSVNHLVSLMVEGDCPVLLNGESGSGKTALLLNFLSEHCRPDISDTALLHLYMNHSTSAETVWDQVQDCLEWRWGRRYTPKGSRKLVCFIDDVHNTEVIVGLSLYIPLFVCVMHRFHTILTYGIAVSFFLNFTIRMGVNLNKGSVVWVFLLAEQIQCMKLKLL